MTVAKRISTKLFVRDDEEELFHLPQLSNLRVQESVPRKIPRVKNPLSGTVLTMNAERFDQFFLVSQRSTVTAACPIRLRVLRNSGSSRNGTLAAEASAEEGDGESPPDLLSLTTLQAISYKLCYLYYNSTSICRQPAPGMVSFYFEFF